MRAVIAGLTIIILFCICAGFELFALGYRTGLDDGFPQGVNHVHNTRKSVSESMVAMGFKDWCRLMASPETIVDDRRREEAIQLCYDVIYYNEGGSNETLDIEP